MGPGDMKREAKKGREAPRLFSFERSPSGMGGASNGRGGGQGMRPRSFLNESEVAGGWREGCR